MKIEIIYEWTLEILEDGDIVDSDFSTVLTFDKDDLIGNDLGLVRNEGNEREGLMGSVWAYVKNGELPDYFSDSMGEKTGYKVPVKFHKELKKYINNN